MTTEFVAWLGLVVAVVSGGAAWGSWREARRANIASTEANRIATDAATSAREAVELQRRADERMAVVFSCWPGRDGDSLVISNTGHSPALVKHVSLTRIRNSWRKYMYDERINTGAQLVAWSGTDWNVTEGDEYVIEWVPGDDSSRDVRSWTGTVQAPPHGPATRDADPRDR